MLARFNVVLWDCVEKDRIRRCGRWTSSVSSAPSEGDMVRDDGMEGEGDKRYDGVFKSTLTCHTPKRALLSDGITLSSKSYTLQSYQIWTLALVRYIIVIQFIFIQEQRRWYSPLSIIYSLHLCITKYYHFCFANTIGKRYTEN
ncbi:hypothetical protein C8F01DRAFT_1088880 [Mycena amicta]|nr:hypothetical protein C8F01DRAFT_1088880 [Mycena amicta]